MLAYIFLYVDIISIEEGSSNDGGLVLIIIAVYGTIVISVKTILALWYHFLQLARGCCWDPIASKLRDQAMKVYWEKET